MELGATGQLGAVALRRAEREERSALEPATTPRPLTEGRIVQVNRLIGETAL